MAYQIEAFIGRAASLQLLADRFASARLVSLEQGFALCPLSDALFGEMNSPEPSSSVGAFIGLTKNVEQCLLASVGGAAIGYIEADYFGGSGGQMGVCWKEGCRGRIEGPGHACINSVLLSLGATRTNGADVFESVGLDRHRSTKDWLEELRTVAPTFPNAQPQRRNTAFIPLLPVAGIVLYVVLYVWATLRYPGGHAADRTAKGFSWRYNYWCNLLNEQALNGEPNTARPFAFGAMFVLALSMAAFWFIFPRHAGLSTPFKWATQWGGLLAMLLGLFIFTGYHDLLLNLAGLCGLIALIGTMAGLRKLRWRRLYFYGWVTIILIVVNNVYYYYPPLTPGLAVVQKLTFAWFLCWIAGISISLRNPRNSVS
ncbi:MAG: hypothetical protein EOO08_07975 [Chitinophagaceae bacterium]|nr:MAG: hypothetical protein EOO08_07975 [Chitinophagaceae bacterium]